MWVYTELFEAEFMKAAVDGSHCHLSTIHVSKRRKQPKKLANYEKLLITTLLLVFDLFGKPPVCHEMRGSACRDRENKFSF